MSTKKPSDPVFGNNLIAQNSSKKREKGIGKKEERKCHYMTTYGCSYSYDEEARKFLSKEQRQYVSMEFPNTLY